MEDEGKKLNKYDIANIKKIISLLKKHGYFYSAFTLNKIFEKVDK